MTPGFQPKSIKNQDVIEIGAMFRQGSRIGRHHGRNARIGVMFPQRTISWNTEDEIPDAVKAEKNNVHHGNRLAGPTPPGQCENIDDLTSG
jgi:hypothetical protein